MRRQTGPAHRNIVFCKYLLSKTFVKRIKKLLVVICLGFLLCCSSGGDLPAGEACCWVPVPPRCGSPAAGQPVDPCADPAVVLPLLVVAHNSFRTWLLARLPCLNTAPKRSLRSCPCMLTLGHSVGMSRRESHLMLISRLQHALNCSLARDHRRVSNLTSFCLQGPHC